MQDVVLDWPEIIVLLLLGSLLLLLHLLFWLRLLLKLTSGRSAR
jgi:hypothetical protein